MRHNHFIRQLFCMQLSNPKTHVLFKELIMIVLICSRTIHPRQCFSSNYQSKSLPKLYHREQEKLRKRENLNAFAFVQNHLNLKWCQLWCELFLGLFLASFVCYTHSSLPSHFWFLLWPTGGFPKRGCPKLGCPKQVCLKRVWPKRVWPNTTMSNTRKWECRNLTSLNLANGLEAVSILFAMMFPPNFKNELNSKWAFMPRFSKNLVSMLSNNFRQHFPMYFFPV